MQEKVSITQYFSWTLVVFAIVLLATTSIGCVVGDDAKDVSALFALGSKGITYAVIGQTLVISLYVNAVRTIFMSEQLMKNMVPTWRMVWMLLTVFGGVGAFAAVFGWFPVDDAKSWFAYIITFIVCIGASILATVLWSRSLNARVNLKFEEYRQQRRKGSDIEQP